MGYFEIDQGPNAAQQRGALIGFVICVAVAVVLVLVLVFDALTQQGR